MSAESFVEGRYRAYRCVVCGAYHLTSGRGDRPEPPEPPKREPPGPKLGDLDWSAVLSPPKEAKPKPVVENPSPQPLSPGEERGPARCAGPCGRDGRAPLVVEGRLVKSRSVERTLRAEIRAGVEVEIEGEPPTIVRVL